MRLRLDAKKAFERAFEKGIKRSAVLTTDALKDTIATMAVDHKV